MHFLSVYLPEEQMAHSLYVCIIPFIGQQYSAVTFHVNLK
jgi:hypothetical protein